MPRPPSPASATVAILDSACHVSTVIITHSKGFPMALPEKAYHQLAPNLRICRTLGGMWQVSGAHGPIDRDAALQAMLAYHDDGFTTWDLADHYGPAEDLIIRLNVGER